MRTRRLIPIALAAVLGVGCSGVTAPAATTPSPQASNQAISSQAPVDAAASPRAPVQVTSSPRVTDQPPAVSYPMPEDAVRQYLAGVAQGDVVRILQVCAIDEMSEGFRFDLSVDRLKAMVLTQSLSPADHPFYAEINKAQQSARILGQVRLLTYSLLSSEQIDGRVISGADKARADRFIQEVNPARLSDLAVVDIRFSNAKLEKDARYLANMAAAAKVDGADEMTERLALFSFEGAYYYIGFTLLRYGGGWKVGEQVATLANTSPLGTAEPTTVEDFDSLTAGG